MDSVKFLLTKVQVLWSGTQCREVNVNDVTEDESALLRNPFRTSVTEYCQTTWRSIPED